MPHFTAQPPPAELEGEIGFTLFRRSNRGLNPWRGEEFLICKTNSEQYRLMEARYIERKALKEIQRLHAALYAHVMKFIRLAEFGRRARIVTTKTFGKAVDNVKRSEPDYPNDFNRKPEKCRLSMNRSSMRHLRHFHSSVKTIPCRQDGNISRNWRNTRLLNRGNRINLFCRGSIQHRISGSSRRMIGPP